MSAKNTTFPPPNSNNHAHWIRSTTKLNYQPKKGGRDKPLLKHIAVQYTTHDSVLSFIE